MRDKIYQCAVNIVGGTAGIANKSVCNVVAGNLADALD